MTSTYHGKVILKIFGEKGAQETRRFVRIKPYADKRTLISIYNAIVRPYFDYSCDVWDVFGETIDIRKGNGLTTLFNTIHDLRFSYFE